MLEYSEYYWMVAWAGKKFPHFEALQQNADKIKKVAVGLHYFHTHPSFIEAFNSSPGVVFIKNESEIFLHSKVYLFVNDPTNWELLLGSANFTHAAFHSNNEAAILIRSNGSNQE